MMTIDLFGIPNCGSVKKARVALENQSIAYRFIDFKKSPPTREQILRWQNALGSQLVNRQGLTYKRLPEQLRNAISVDLIIEQPSLIKRPLIEWDDGSITVGLDHPKLQ